MVSVSYLGLPLTFPFFFTSTQLSAAKRSESSEVSRNHVAKWKQGVGVTMEPTCEDGRHRGHEARTGEGRLEEMEMERRELKMKRVQGVKVNRFWTAEGENEDNVTERRGAWRREHKAGPEQPPAVWRCVDVTVFIRWEGRSLLSTPLWWAMGPFIQNACEQWIIDCAFYFTLIQGCEFKKPWAELVQVQGPSKCPSYCMLNYLKAGSAGNQSCYTDCTVNLSTSKQPSYLLPIVKVINSGCSFVLPSRLTFNA